jgi:hypothetical protein
MAALLPISVTPRQMLDVSRYCTRDPLAVS